MSYDYKKYEFTAFTEADFLNQGGNGSSIGCGDSFTMPGSASVCLSTWDNDSSLSGDGYYNDNANDSSGQKAMVDGARVGGQMYAESYHVLHGSDGKTYYMIEIEIEGHDAPGAGDDYFTFYGAVPPAGVELTVANTCNVKGNWVDFRCIGAGEKAPANEAPTFTNIPADGIFCVDENQTFVVELAATDADGDALTYEIVGGADAGAFEIDATTGELKFVAGPDYEAPTDGNGNNVYDVTVKVSDGNGGEEIKPLWIKVKDVDESTGGTCIVVEAEDMQLCGYRVQNGDDASGGQLIQGAVGCWSSAKTTFDGPAGQYDLKLSVLDENDGQGRICVNINGVWVLDVVLDQDNGGDGYNGTQTFRDLMINDIDLQPGDVVTIWGLGEGGEFARIDKLEFCSEKTDPMTAELGDRVWFDSNKDGIQDGDEIGAAGVTVLLKDAAGNTLAQTETDASGNYLFEGLAAGDYKVCVVAPGAYAFTDQNAGDDAADSDVMANGMSDVVSLAEGESNLTVDAGLVDPGTASLEGRVFCDDNDNDVDDGEQGVGGVAVTLLTAAGVVVANTTTAADGSYSFTGLDAGDYKVMFDESTTGGKELVGTDAGNDDTIDSDADANGMTGVYTLNIGDNVTDVDAGVEVPNTDPTPADDAGMTCADEAVKIDVLANDTDADGDSLSITQVGGMDIAEGGTVTVNGVDVMLMNGQLNIDGSGSAALEALDIGETEIVSIEYTVSDGNGGTGTATADVTFCGTANTVAAIDASLPTSDVKFQIIDENSPGGSSDEAFTLKISGSGDARLDGLVITEAYCVAVYDPLLFGDFGTNIDNAPMNFGSISVLDDASIIGSSITNIKTGVAADEVDNMINWILNQDFGSQGYTDAEIQGAIWGLTDDLAFVGEGAGDLADAIAICDAAVASGGDYVAGAGDLIGLYIDPNAATEAAGHTQPFVVAVAFDDLDCIC